MAQKRRRCHGDYTRNGRRGAGKEAYPGLSPAFGLPEDQGRRLAGLEGHALLPREAAVGLPLAFALRRNAGIARFQEQAAEEEPAVDTEGGGPPDRQPLEEVQGDRLVVVRRVRQDARARAFRLVLDRPALPEEGGRLRALPDQPQGEGPEEVPTTSTRSSTRRAARGSSISATSIP